MAACRSSTLRKTPRLMAIREKTHPMPQNPRNDSARLHQPKTKLQKFVYRAAGSRARFCNDFRAAAVKVTRTSATRTNQHEENAAFRVDP